MIALQEHRRASSPLRLAAPRGPSNRSDVSSRSDLFPYIDESLQEQWLLGYVELLQRHKMWNVATEVVRCAWLGSVWSLSQQSTSVALSCGRCGRRTRPHAPCERCQPRHVPDTCSVCHKVRPRCEAAPPRDGPRGWRLNARRPTGGPGSVRVVPGLRARRPPEAHAGMDGHAHAVPRRLRPPLPAGVNADPVRA